MPRAWRRMRLLLLLAPALVLGGCMLPFCGETVYHLSGVTASARFTDEAWDVARAEAGVREANFSLGRSAPFSVQGSDGALTLGAEGSERGAQRVYVSFRTEGEQGSHAEVERAADAHIEANEARARAAIDAFARGSGWTPDTPLAWDKGMLHGDC